MDEFMEKKDEVVKTIKDHKSEILLLAGAAALVCVGYKIGMKYGYSVGYSAGVTNCTETIFRTTLEYSNNE